MIKNLWKKITLYCGYHAKPVALILKDGVGTKNLFYSCPKYYPESREDTEKACFNHISSEDLEKIVDHLSNIIENEIILNNHICLTGYAWKWKFYDLNIMEHTEDNIRISVRNKKSLK